MKPARLILVRHAEINCGRLLCGSYDARLSPAGLAQVERLRERLAADSFSALYSSPLLRALDTAAAAPDGLLLRRVRGLAEIDCGELEGVPLERIQREWPEHWIRNQSQHDDDFRWPGGETYRCFRRRVLRAVCAIASLHPGGRVLIFTHAGVVNQILGTIYGQSAAHWVNYRPGNTAITEVEWSGSNATVLRFDDRKHLE